jgi:Tfp pilus assembly protein PilO
MPSNARTWKKLVRAALVVLVAADAVLLFVALRAAAAPDAPRRGRDTLREQHQLLAADVRRVTAIRAGLPQVQYECDRFFAEQLLPEAGAYSAVVEDLGDIAQKANLRIAATNFKQRDLEKRGVVQVDITASVDGDYASLVRFINGLERSKNFYLLDSLTLASSSGGTLRLNLQLRTYFRT